jgi:hypothetical protein
MLCTDKALTSGLMAGCIMVATRTIRSMASVSTFGSMAELTSVNGIRESKLLKESTYSLMVPLGRDYMKATLAKSGSQSLRRSKSNSSRSLKTPRNKQLKSPRSLNKLSKSSLISRRQKQTKVMSIKRVRLTWRRLSNKLNKLSLLLNQNPF